MKVRQAIPLSWIDTVTDAPITLGHDVGTTERGTSNPSTLAVMQHVAPLYIVRLLLAWKTGDPEVSRQLIRLVLRDILDTPARKAKRLVIDASNEVFYARDLRRIVRGSVPCVLVKGGEKLRHKGEELDAKTLLGNIYINHLDDGLIALPSGDWINEDHRLVKHERGSFATDTGKNGQHGDTFDGCKLALWGHVGTSTGDHRGIQGMQVGSGIQSPGAITETLRVGSHSILMQMARSQADARSRFTT